LALDAGFINPFPHRAIFDVLTMLKVMSRYPMADIINYQKMPYITVRAMINKPFGPTAEIGAKEVAAAKSQRYSWQRIGDKEYLGCWVKRIKENQFEAEKAKCSFPVVRIE
jgi:hypothetical protein